MAALRRSFRCRWPSYSAEASSCTPTSRRRSSRFRSRARQFQRPAKTSPLDAHDVTSSGRVGASQKQRDPPRDGQASGRCGGSQWGTMMREGAGSTIPGKWRVLPSTRSRLPFSGQEEPVGRVRSLHSVGRARRSPGGFGVRRRSHNVCAGCADEPDGTERGPDRLPRSRRLHLVSEEDLARDYPEFDLGAVPPIGGGRRDPVVIDSRLAESPRAHGSTPTRCSRPARTQATYHRASRPKGRSASSPRAGRFFSCLDAALPILVVRVVERHRYVVGRVAEHLARPSSTRMRLSSCRRKGPFV